eukprot:gnl/MRDRNA2_/MRDRNA2_105949_c0_seq1.p1 gnl/MRDRNA2_/MRDRNA2_105949_c0~~gnl/MRDRNA2_/MRDRNA2_105949_c0_seq1.p1  ORF type:complete len:150 (+),score=26.01 gnl/MRDRNA2_/MRDRNA2_105949_c0_seq1:145-594(+)
MCSPDRSSNREPSCAECSSRAAAAAAATKKDPLLANVLRGQQHQIQRPKHQIPAIFILLPGAKDPKVQSLAIQGHQALLDGPRRKQALTIHQSMNKEDSTPAPTNNTGSGPIQCLSLEFWRLVKKLWSFSTSRPIIPGKSSAWHIAKPC